MVLKEILSTAASSATFQRLFGWFKIVFNRAGARGTFVCVFPKKLAVLPSLCREEFYVLDKRWFLIAPVDPPLQVIVFSQVSHFSLSPFLDRRK